jgi:probable rRNA maturation factor
MRPTAPRMNVLVCNRQRGVPVDLAALAEFAARAFEACARKSPAVHRALAIAGPVEISLVSDRRIAALHWQFLQARGATDVITFEHGEIIISAAAAWRGAREHGETLERELCRYIVHGLLHLRGYDDAAPAARAAMWRVQEDILRRIYGRPAAPVRNVRKRIPRR